MTGCADDAAALEVLIELVYLADELGTVIYVTC